MINEPVIAFIGFGQAAQAFIEGRGGPAEAASQRRGDLALPDTLETKARALLAAPGKDAS